MWPPILKQQSYLILLFFEGVLYAPAQKPYFLSLTFVMQIEFLNLLGIR
jgi:hypothetical protein